LNGAEALRHTPTRLTLNGDELASENIRSVTVSLNDRQEFVGGEYNDEKLER